MPCHEPDRTVHPEESRTAWHHGLQATSILCNLRFGPDMEVGKVDLRRAYWEWIGEPDEDYDRCPPVIGDLHEPVTRMGAEPVCTGTRRDRADTEKPESAGTIS